MTLYIYKISGPIKQALKVESDSGFPQEPDLPAVYAQSEKGCQVVDTASGMVITKYKLHGLSLIWQEFDLCCWMDKIFCQTFTVWDFSCFKSRRNILHLPEQNTVLVFKG